MDNKELLLIDLSARLPYRVKCDGVGIYFNQYNDTYETIEIHGELLKIDALKLDNIIVVIKNSDYICNLEFVKPYLRSMSSMTEEENQIYQSKQTIIFDFKNNKFYVDNYYSLDYLNSIHVDYRGLIEKGLALEAPEGMY